MIADKNKGIVNIEYNHLNLPIKIDFESDENAIIGNSISYYYDATGVKLQKAVQLENISSASYTEYDNGFIYERGTFSAQPLLKFFAHAEGYVEPNGNNFDYIYQYKDHTSTSLSAGLGNIRLSYKQGTIDLGIVEEKNRFYAERSRSNPFGLKHKGYNNVVNGTEYPYGFGGKEEQNELGLKWLDFHARNYDASLGRWMNVDPLAEIMRRHSPYNYAFNNPIFWIDPDGRAPQASQTADVYYDWEEGEYRTQDGESASHEEAMSQGEGDNEVSTWSNTPRRIDFSNVKTKDELIKFKESIIEWFAFVNNHADDTDIYPADIINFWAESDEGNEKSFGQEVWDFLDSIGGSDPDDTTNVYLKKGDNKVRIGYNKNTKEHGRLYRASYIHYQWDDKTNRGRISIRSKGTGGGTPQAIVFMYFTGKNRSYYEEFKESIENSK